MNPPSSHHPTRQTTSRPLAAWLLAIVTVLSLPAQSQSQSRKPPADHLVETTRAELQPVSISHVRTGTFRARRLVRVFNQEEGRITRMAFYEGDEVAANDVLVELDDALLSARLDKSRATRRKAESDLERIRGLIGKRLTSERELSGAETAVEVARAEERVLQTRLGYTRIRAPFAGVITARLAQPGDVVPRHTHIMSVADPASLVTELSVSELLIPYLKRGDPADVRIDALGNRTFRGQILRIHPTLDPQTRRGRVEVILDPVPAGALAGQFCRVTLRTPEIERLTIPFRALRRDRKGEYVYRVADDVAQRIAVRSGVQFGERVEIVEGLSAGEHVVVRGFLGLRDGKPVKNRQGQAGNAGA